MSYVCDTKNPMVALDLKLVTLKAPYMNGVTVAPVDVRLEGVAKVTLATQN